MGQNLGPDRICMKIFVSCKIEAVLYIYNQASLLFVCGHSSYKGNRRFAISGVLLLLRSNTLGTRYFSKSNCSICAVGFGSGIEMMYFPYVA